MELKKSQASARVSRRRVLKGGLAGLAAALMSPSLSACDESRPPMQDAGVDAALRDAGMDSAVDAGGIDFPLREVPARPNLRSLIDRIGPLRPADANGVRLPEGFSSRIVARTGSMVPGSTYEWHPWPDGGATFATEDGGWIYVSNSEVPLNGGVGALRFDARGELLRGYPILESTSLNCAGGLTPWHTWLSCEEIPRGQVYECDPWGERPAVVRPALGVFEHEAVCVDPVNWHLYLSEDERDGGFYRFVPERMNALGFPSLETGRLEIAIVDEMGGVRWEEVPDPQFTGETPTRSQVEFSTVFRGGEGVWYHNGIVYLSTKRDNRVWAYNISSATIEVIYDNDGILRGVDNVTVSCCGDVLVAEDGGSMQIVTILPSGELKPLMQIEGQDDSEIAGPAFDPSGTRLYFSSQRGSDGDGLTYEIQGPFHEVVG